jgi:heptose I phosphotransferase
MTTLQSHGKLMKRLVRGSRWIWRADETHAALPQDLDDRVMQIVSTDRFHAKQGRSTARISLHTPAGHPISGYLKRHVRLPWLARLAALLFPSGRFSPGAAEWAHLQRVQTLGLSVPKPLAAGERIGPWGALQSYLLIAELTDQTELHLLIPFWRTTLQPVSFAQRKRVIARNLAQIVARLHRARLFHNDLYLCHVFAPEHPDPNGDVPLALIDFHRLQHRRLTACYARWKDIGQLLYSSFEVPGITARDRLRFWAHYVSAAGLRTPWLDRRIIRFRAESYYARARKRARERLHSVQPS